MYIGVGWLFCVTLPAEIRYGIGVRMCAPSMPLPSPPSTRLSRVAPHDACFSTSTSGMPYLAKMPFSLATNSGAASVSAMKPSLAPFTSGPAACANARRGKLRLRGAEQRGGAGAGLQKRAAADCSRCGSWLSLCVVLSVRSAAFAAASANKKPQPEVGSFEPPQVSGVACWPVVGPDAVACAPTSSGPLLSSVVPDRRHDPEFKAMFNELRRDWRIVANCLESRNAARRGRTLLNYCAVQKIRQRQLSGHRHAPDAPGREVPGDIAGVERRSGEGADLARRSRLGSARRPRAS